jgi:hypothetical protein
MLMQAFDLADYAFSAFAVPSFLTTLAILGLGVAVLVREHISLVSVSFFLLTLAVSVWLFSFSCVYLSTNEHTALWWMKVAYLGVPFIASATYQFTVAVLRVYERFKKLAWVGWVGAAMFSALAVGTDALFAETYRYWWGYYPRYGPLGALFIAFFATLLVASMAHYWIEYQAEHRRHQQPTDHKLHLDC